MAHGSFPIEGEIVPASEAAKGCGFVNVAAMNEWCNFRDLSQKDTLDRIVADVCNLKQQIKQLAERVSELDCRTASSMRVG